ncbi:MULTISPECIES: VOC family protein [Bacteroidales]|uniref:VOC family protein n=1 Tax=Bacteroidales TaxID=171549 RepID=UPI0035A06D8A
MTRREKRLLLTIFLCLILTPKLTETKEFYTQILGFGVTFENEFYLLLHTPTREAEISFLLPHHPSHSNRSFRLLSKIKGCI